MGDRGPRSEERPEPQRWLTDKMRLRERAVIERLYSVPWARSLQVGCNGAPWWRRPPTYPSQRHSRDGPTPRLCGQVAAGPGWEGVVAIEC